MSRTCSSCGALAAPFHGYCVKCGAALGAAGAASSSNRVRPFMASTPARPAAARAEPAEVRRAEAAPRAARVLSQSERVPERGATPLAVGMTSEAREAAPAYAPPHLRVAARIADGVLLVGLNRLVVALAVFGAELAHVPFKDAEGALDPPLFLGVVAGILVLDALYLVVFTGLWGQTLGKRLFGIRVLGEGGRPLGLGRAALRETAGKLLCAATFGLGYLGILFEPRRRGWHDRIAGSVVLRDAPRARAADLPAPLRRAA